MADTYSGSWTNAAVDYPLFIQKETGDTTNANGGSSPDLLYSAADFRDYSWGFVQESGRVGEDNFAISYPSTTSITIGPGLGFIKSASGAYGVYFIRQKGDVTITLPAYGSGTEKYRVVAEIDDRADNPSAQYPTNYGWHWRVMDNVGTAVAATPAGTLSVGVVQKTSAGALPTAVLFDNGSPNDNRRNLVQIGRSTGWKSVGAVGQPGFTSTWTNYGGTYQPVQFQRMNNGTVNLRGLAAGGASSGSGEAIFILPFDFQPDYTQVFDVRCQLRNTQNYPPTGTVTGTFRLYGSTRLYVYGANETNAGYVVPQVHIADVDLKTGGIAATGFLLVNFNGTDDWLSLSGVSFTCAGR